MVYEKKDYDFVLFINKGVQKNQPIVSGTIHINGQEIPIVGWKRTSKKGHEMIAGGKSIPREKQPTKDDWSSHDASPESPFNDPIPF